MTEIHKPVAAPAPADAEATPGDLAAPAQHPTPAQSATGDARDEAAAAAAERRWWLGGPADRTALLIWFFWHVATYVYMVLAAPGRTDAPLLDRLTPWDSDNFITIAQHGYDGSPGMADAPKLSAFFPGIPLLLRYLHVFVSDWSLAIVLVSLVASAVVAVALSRLSESFREGTGTWTVLAFFLSPFAVFMLAGYSEAPFLALAIPAWLLARRGRWEAAAVCAAFASSIRVSGLFLLAGLVIQFLVAENGLRGKGWRTAPWLALPAVPVLAYMAYLWSRTGDLLAWKHAEADYWGRFAEWPWQVFVNTWNRSLEESVLRTSYREEILAALVLAALVVWQAVRRRWGNLAYLAPQAVALLAMSSFYMSVGRASLLWWPLYLSVGIAGARRPWVFMAYVAVAAPVMAINVGNFTTGAWVG
ncbi:mannosyltransferase family protein [Planotetraspora silvatica]|uniref:mannosyltransferase family protein n=1 Tax=Planotetraspora silvatica TaxID=234614 RepID=UPI00194E5BE8|nr:mannosyltransferase family protein [Planotetraspora silvatica]